MNPASEERVAHTPTPWILLNERSRSIYAQRNGERQHIANTEVLDCAEPTDESAEQACDEEAANTAFIVTACNAHEALVDALRDATLFINHRNCMGESERFPDVCACGALQLNAKCRAALKLAVQ